MLWKCVDSACVTIAGFLGCLAEVNVVVTYRSVHTLLFQKIVDL